MTSTWRDRLILLSPLAAIGVLAIVPALEGGPTICPFALSTGMACPGCGMTRAASHLMRGDFSGAIALHPLVPAFAIMAIVGWVWYLLRRSGRVQPISNRLLNGILIATAFALVAVWVARMAMGTLPPV